MFVHLNEILLLVLENFYIVVVYLLMNKSIEYFFHH